MKPESLKQLLVEIGLSQTDLAKLIEVTPRAVSLWMTAQRGIPGPVAAYVSLLAAAPQGLRQAELAKLHEENRTMKDGMYLIRYKGQSGEGHGTLVFEGGSIYGADVAGGIYDGQYWLNSATGLATVKLRVQMKAGRPSVIGIVQPFDWILDVETEMNPQRDADTINVRTELGRPIVAAYEFLRSLPLAA